MGNKYADLHIHSYYSDGTMSPEEILEIAIAKNVGLLAITDHDMLTGSKELMHIARDHDIQCITGVELNAIEEGDNIHILGYGIDLADSTFGDFVKKNRSLLEQVNMSLIIEMQKDYECITVPDYMDYTYDRRKGGWKALQYLQGKGITKTLQEGFAWYPKYQCFYSCVAFPSVNKVCKYIHAAGGKAILAHPGKVISATSLEDFKKGMLQMIDFGVDGIECYYPTHTADMTEVCLSICKDRDLLITTGSDCHGEFQYTEIGEMMVSMEDIRLGDLYMG